MLGARGLAARGEGIGDRGKGLGRRLGQRAIGSVLLVIAAAVLEYNFRHFSNLPPSKRAAPP